jgi:hypothetical protein
MQQFTQRFQQKIDIFGMRRMPHKANTPYLSAQVAQARPDFHFGIHPGRAQANSGFRIVLDVAMKTMGTKKP